MLTSREAMHVWEQKVYGNSLYLPFNFAVNLKMLGIINEMFETSWYVLSVKLGFFVFLTRHGDTHRKYKMRE